MNMNERRQQRRNRGHSSEIVASDNAAFEQDDDTRAINESALASKHRDKSMEVAQRIGVDKPNEVVEELHVVRDKIKQKIRSNLANELEKVREEEKKKPELDEEGEKEESALKLDLSMSTVEQTRPSSVTAKQGGSSYRLKGQGKREATRFDGEEVVRAEEKVGEEVEEDKLKEKAKKKFKKIGHQVLDVRIIGRLGEGSFCRQFSS